MKVIVSIILGALFGAVLIFSEAVYWHRIQEMFHFQSFHMYGLLFSAIATGIISIQIIRRFKIKSAYGNLIEIKPKKLNLKGNIFGGLLFGTGWALAGACTAPIFINIGLNWQIGLIIFGGALSGVLLYGLLHKRLN